LRIAYVNPAYKVLTGYSAEECLDQSWRMLDASAEELEQISGLKAALGRAEPYSGELADIRSDGTTWLSHVQAQPVKSSNGDLKHYVITQRSAADSTNGQDGLQVGLLQRELRLARQKVASLDRVDLASGVFRYEYFLELADRDCRRAQRDETSVAMVFFEVNDLDVYGQTFGTKAADSCLRMIAAQVTGALRRAGDLCGCDNERRIVALIHDQDIENVGRLATRIASNIRGLGLHNPRAESGRYVTVRFGIAVGMPTRSNFLTTLTDQARANLDEGQDVPAPRRAAHS
jgi:PAS domain S-box-containing protein/diguanylate cyclase (GGDEF)-like protein